MLLRAFPSRPTSKGLIAPPASGAAQNIFGRPERLLPVRVSVLFVVTCAFRVCRWTMPCFSQPCNVFCARRRRRRRRRRAGVLQDRVRVRRRAGRGGPHPGRPDAELFPVGDSQIPLPSFRRGERCLLWLRGGSVCTAVILQRQPPRCFQSFGKSYGFENNMLTTPSVVSLRLYDPPTDCYSRLRRSVL